ncbi:MAG: winged helix-turn-helix transcriptional regulator [Mycoplasmatales bacterium]
MNEYPIYYTMEKIKGKWSIIILCFLNEGPKRNGELLRLIPYISQKMLTAHLRKLEEEKLINRKQISEKPLLIEYSLTDYGSTLKPLLDEMRIWGEKNNPNFNKEEAIKQKLAAKYTKLKDIK